MEKFTYKGNIKKDGETVRGMAMYKVVDHDGVCLPRASCLDYELATFFIDWINEGFDGIASMKEIHEYLKTKYK